MNIVDTHTGGEPTRVVVSGGPRLAGRTVSQRLACLASEHDAFRATVVNEPRGSDAVVGAMLLPAVNPENLAGVVFFNNVGYLGMCGHGMIGLAVTLGHLGRMSAGTHRIETPVGVVAVEYDGRNTAAIENVASYRYKAGVTVHVPGHGRVAGDIAWGGNWFFLSDAHGERVELANADRLTQVCLRVRQALSDSGISGAAGEPIDHVELFGPPANPGNHSRNFVLCPGGSYDRSPCGTGTSAKLACLHADGELCEGKTWRQESITGAVFEASILRVRGDSVVPRIRGSAYVTAEGTLLVDPVDPLSHGVPR